MGFDLGIRGSVGFNLFRNRLTRASRSGAELATYVYDAFNRLVEVRPAGSAPRVTVWSGWQEIEEYLGGVLWQRRSYGLGLDELVRLEADLDQDGSLETDYAPLYDAAGNLAVLTGAQGRPVAKYFYSPFGDTMAAHVDASPAQVYQVLFKAGELWLEFSEEVLTAPFFEAVTSGEVYLEETAGGTRHALVATFPVGEGMQARQRVVLTPSTAPESGVEVELVVASEATRDLFENTPSQAYSLTFPWPDPATPQQVLADTAAPEVEQVYLKDSHLEIELSELVDPEAAAPAILIGGAPASWELLPDGYTLCTTSPLPPGSHSVEITTAPLDLSGQGLISAFTTTAVVATTATGEQLYTKPPATQVEFAALGNLFSFHGRPLDVATGLVYFRNRYYDPELARFITADPLGYVDGPSQYGFAMNSPASYSDPLGLESADIYRRQADLRAIGIESLDVDRRQAEDLAAAMANPYVQGPLLVVGGCAEAGLGATAAAGSAGLAAVPGAVAMVHGADVCSTGFRTIWTGRNQETLTKRGVESGLVAVGVEPQVASMTASTVDLGVSVFGVVASERILLGPVRAPAVVSSAEVSSVPRGRLVIEVGNFSASEIRSAEHLASLGRDVRLRPPFGTRVAGTTSDLLVDGVTFDVFTPISTNPNRIISAIAKKNSQARGIVLGLSETTVRPDQLGNILARVKGAGATNIDEIVVIGN